MKGSSKNPRKILGSAKISFNTVTSIVNSLPGEGSKVSEQNIAQGKINKTFYQKKMSSEPYSHKTSSRVSSKRSSVVDDNH